MAMIATIIKLITLIFSTWLEHNKEKKEKKEEIIKEVQDGIKNKDASAITMSFDKLHRL